MLAALFTGFAILLLSPEPLLAKFAAEPPAAVLYERGSSFTKVLYRYEHSVSEKDGVKTVNNKFVYPDGTLALEEKINYRADGSLEDYWRLQNQVAEETRMYREGDQILFTRKHKGKEEKDQEKWRSNIITTDQIVTFVMNNWEEIYGGKEIDLRVLIPTRLETVGFSIEKLKDAGSVGGKKTVVIRMAPSSMFIRAFVEPILFHYEVGEIIRLIMVDGRMAVKKADSNGKYSDAIGHLLFTYDIEPSNKTLEKKAD